MCAIFLLIIFYQWSLLIMTNMFPTAWKLAVVVPILKRGEVTDSSTNRRVSLLCPFSKLFEKVILRFLSFLLKNIIISNQHEYFSGRSMTANLLAFTSVASEIVYKRGQLDIIHFDFSKAFDSVQHAVMLPKLSVIGVCGKIIVFQTTS